LTQGVLAPGKIRLKLSAMPSDDDNIDIKAELVRLKALKAGAPKVKARNVKRTFTIDERILKRFLNAIDRKNLEPVACINEAVLLWLKDNDAK
jgi:hypothetical protein